MVDSSRLFLAACSRDNKEIPYKNFRKSILKGASPEEYSLVKMLGYEKPTPVWGVAESFRSNHEELTEGQDYVLFYTKKRVYTHAGILHQKAESSDFARKMWQRKDEGQLNIDPKAERSLLMLFNDVFRVDIPSPDLHDLLGYNVDYLLGGSKMPQESRLNTIRSEYGSVPAYIETYRKGRRRESPNSVEQRVEDLLDLSEPDTDFELREPSYSPREEIIRSEAFRKAIRRAYENKCAICGASRETPQGVPEVEAAHIYPKGVGGPDIVQNGLALCKLHHWAFEHGWFTLDNDYSIVVRKGTKRTGYQEFKQLEEERPFLPDPNLRPLPKFLQAHRELHGL